MRRSRVLTVHRPGSPIKSSTSTSATLETVAIRLIDERSSGYSKPLRVLLARCTDHCRAPFHALPYTGWQPSRRSTLDPKSSEDSSAPRRQLDGGIPPAADGRGGGQTHPYQRGCPRRPCCGAVLVVARPDGVCPEERPAGIARSGVVAVARPGQQPSRSVGRRCPACGVHPSGIGVRDPAVRLSGVRSPGAVVQSVRRSAVCCPTVQRPAVCCPPVRCPAVWCLPPSVRTRRSPPMLRWWRWGSRSRRPGRGRRWRSRVGQWEVGGGPGPGWGAAAAAALAG